MNAIRYFLRPAAADFCLGVAFFFEAATGRAARGRSANTTSGRIVFPSVMTYAR
jgi:hypothetical protein